jgi:ribosomal protein S18 acetylase RimI-like enzyme
MPCRASASRCRVQVTSNVRPHKLKVRKLEAEDAPVFLALRLFGLQESPSSFGSSFEEEENRTVAEVEAHLTSSNERKFFGYFLGQELVGIVGVGREQGIKERHTAFVRSMYVAPSVRSQGVGQRLMSAALQEALSWPGIEQVFLAVTAGNQPALKLYRRLGFTEVGRMPRALQVGGTYFDEIHMVRVAGEA